MKDTFRTFSYKGEYIHTCINRDASRPEVNWNGREFVSVRAAKLAITRELKTRSILIHLQENLESKGFVEA